MDLGHEEDLLPTEVVVSFPPVDDRTVQSLEASSYRSYLRRAREGPVAVGDE
jgi:hypothetical protein